MAKDFKDSEGSMFDMIWDLEKNFFIYSCDASGELFKVAKN